MNEQPPVKEGEIYDLKIDALGGKGDGIGRVKGFVLFVPGVKMGDLVKVRITKVLPKVGFAEVVKITVTGSPAQEKRYENIRPEGLQEPEDAPDSSYEDTEDFGEN